MDHPTEIHTPDEIIAADNAATTARKKAKGGNKLADDVAPQTYTAKRKEMDISPKPQNNSGRQPHDLKIGRSFLRQGFHRFELA